MGPMLSRRRRPLLRRLGNPRKLAPFCSVTISVYATGENQSVFAAFLPSFLAAVALVSSASVVLLATLAAGANDCFLVAEINH
jgi:hypothetical protein